MAINSILIIDDDPIHNYLSTLVIRIERITDNIFIKRNGKEAIDFLLDLSIKNLKCPELILVDVFMPIMDGFEFLEAFEHLQIKNKDQAKIAMVSASCQEKKHCGFPKNKNIAFFQKPLSSKKIKNLLEISL